jgi:hypothetical protein
MIAHFKGRVHCIGTQQSGTNSDKAEEILCYTISKYTKAHACSFISIASLSQYNFVHAKTTKAVPSGWAWTASKSGCVLRQQSLPHCNTMEELR